MALATLGRTSFEDAFIPVPNKNEFGMDTLSRRMEGYAGDLETYVASLRQGQTYNFAGILFYLQTWNPGNSTPVASVDLHYKGLSAGGTPKLRKQRQVVSAVGRISKDFSGENDGLGRFYRKDLLWQIGDTVPGPGSFGTTAAYVRDRYTTGVVMEFTYKAMQTTYRYVTIGEPVGPRHDTVGVDYTQVPENVRIIVADGPVYGQVGWQQFFDLNPAQIQRKVSFDANEVIGSPYWECEDVIRLELGDPA